MPTLACVLTLVLQEAFISFVSSLSVREFHAANRHCAPLHRNDSSRESLHTQFSEECYFI